MFGDALQNGVGVGIGNIPSLTSLPYSQQLNLAVASLFASGEPGIWLDNADWQTGWFQDAAGTTPITAMEQPLGLALSKDQGLRVGAELITNGTNPTVTTGWTAGVNNTLSIVSNQIKCVNAAADGAFFGQSFAVTAGKTYKFQFDCVSDGTSKAARALLGTALGTSNRYLGTAFAFGASRTFYYTATGTETIFLWFYAGSQAANNYILINNVSCKQIAGNHVYQSTSGVRPVVSARYNLLTGTAALSTQSVTVAAGSYTLYFTGAGSVALSGAASGTKTAGSNVITCTAGTLTLTVTGSVLTADLRPSNEAIGLLPPYQAVVNSSTYDGPDNGFLPYISFNGTQWMQTAATDYSGVSKLLVVAGVRKLSDAGQGVVFELTSSIASNNGAVLLSAPNSAAANLNFSSKGTTQADNTVTTYAAPTTRVLTGVGDISAPSNIVRVNGAQVGAVTTSQGTGNYANAAQYIGASAGTSKFFTGRLYQLIVRGSTVAANDAQIGAAENYCNLRTRAY